MRGKFLLKKCFILIMAMQHAYMSLSLVGNACTKFVVILFVHVSILACRGDLCTLEKHMLAFVDLIHALPRRS
jgi:hypothetical protein